MIFKYIDAFYDMRSIECSKYICICHFYFIQKLLKSYNINLKLLKNRLMILKRHKTELKKLL